MPKRGRNEPKAKGPHHHHQFLKTSCFQRILSFGILLCSKGGESSISKIDISKPSWTLRGGSHLGGVLFSQRKSIWNRGRKIQILKMLCKILFNYLWLLQKNFEKDFTKEFAKTKHVVQTWSKILYKNKETIHAYLVSIYIGSIPSKLFTYIMQTSSFMHFYFCFGLCWHQSPKRGRLKGN
jgi:hypothetical protein